MADNGVTVSFYPQSDETVPRGYINAPINEIAGRNFSAVLPTDAVRGLVHLIELMLRYYESDIALRNNEPVTTQMREKLRELRVRCIEHRQPATDGFIPDQQISELVGYIGWSINQITLGSRKYSELSASDVQTDLIDLFTVVLEYWRWVLAQPDCPHYVPVVLNHLREFIALR